MPPRQTESKGALYSAIFFAALTIIVGVIAVVLYVKLEDYRKSAEDARDELAQVARKNEIKDVGTVEKRETVLGKAIEYFDSLYTAVTGPIAEDSDLTLEVKLNETTAEIDRLYESLLQIGFDTGENSLLRVSQMLTNAQASAIQAIAQKDQQLKKLQADFDAATEEFLAAESAWQTQLDAQKNIADQAQARHDQLNKLIDDRFGEQLDSMKSQLSDTRDLLQQKENDLLKAQSELKKTEKRLDYYVSIIEDIKPQPLKEVKAYKPDGSIVSVDPAASIVIIDLGSEDHVYPGLTFAVYNKNAPIPPDGKGKAEIEVFDVEKRIAIARIKKDTLQQGQSIIAEDPIANLIWDADAINTFVVAGDFDFDGDGFIDKDGVQHIKQLINDWNAQVAEQVTIKTDFVVLGTTPIIPIKPGIEEIDIDPQAMEKYEQALAENQRYTDVIEQAKTFSIPVFDITRFKYFIGQ